MQSIDLRAFNQLFEAGDRVYVAGSSGEPQALVTSLKPGCALRFFQQPFGAVNTTDLSAIGQGSTLECYFMSPALADGYAKGRVRFVPMQWRALYNYLKELQFDKVLLLAGYDHAGVLRFAHNVDFIDAVLENARTVILEVSRGFNAPAGAPAVPTSMVDYCVESESPALTVASAKSDETAERIADHVASLIQDGDCLQIGIGAIPSSIMARLRDRNDLGFHGGLVDDGVMSLIENGNITGQRKTIDQGLHVTGAALGTERLIEWLSRTDTVCFRGGNYTHDAGVICQLDQFVSINSAVQVDLQGQVNGEVVGDRQISGTGGSVDYMRSAKISSGGRSIVALPSTAKRGEISRIVPRVEAVTALRSDVDYVVTEYGVANLRRASLWERADALAEIAHPKFKEMLRDENLSNH